MIDFCVASAFTTEDGHVHSDLLTADSKKQQSRELSELQAPTAYINDD